jgi:hypothetical protein
MIASLASVQKYQEVFYHKGLELELLTKSADDMKRTESVIIQIDPKNFSPLRKQELMRDYTKKILEYGYNFMLRDGDQDIAFLSIYGNDQMTKTAFASIIGIIPTYRGGNIVIHLVRFALDFAKDIGMEKFRAEIHKENAKWLKYLLHRHNFFIESETDNNTVMIIRDL